MDSSVHVSQQYRLVINHYANVFVKLVGMVMLWLMLL